MILLKVALVGIVVVGLASTARSVVWDASADFSTVGNPNGAWTYGYTSGGIFTPCTNSFTGNPFDGWTSAPGQVCVMKNVTGIPSYGIAPGHLSLECDFTEPVLRFVAPITALYELSLDVGGTTAYQNGGFGNVSASYATLTVKGTSVAETSFVDNVKSWRISDLGLSSGDVVDVALGQHYGGGNTDTMMTFSAVPEPTSLLSFMVSFAIAASRWRRAKES